MGRFRPPDRRPGPDVLCLVGRHQLGPWLLRPGMIAIPITWLRWERWCSRCHRGQDRRWFEVAFRPPPADPPRWSGTLTPEQYLALIGAVAPPPDSLPRGTPAGMELPS